MTPQEDSYKTLTFNHHFDIPEFPFRYAESQRRLVKRGETVPPGDGIWRIRGGWAAQQSVGSGSRRHLFSFLVPNDFLPEASAHYEIIALTDVEFLKVEEGANDEAQADAARGRLFVHATRLAAYGAYERIADLFLELHGRLTAAGQANGLRFPFPIGQEQIGHMMGLSEVHVNRTIAKLRADGLLLSGPGWYALPDPARLRRRVELGATAA
jgi:CRP-like cAMP-binding protein